VNGTEIAIVVTGRVAIAASRITTAVAASRAEIVAANFVGASRSCGGAHPRVTTADGKSSTTRYSLFPAQNASFRIEGPGVAGSEGV
jgi:hypothetical protein